MSTEYVCGFAFAVKRTQVLLIRKKRPDWQAGYLNGVGGKIELNETAALAMSREFHEETGVFIASPLWRRFATLHHKSRDGIVHFFTTDLTSEQADAARSTTDEQVLWVPTHMSKYRTMNNLRWLVPMAADRDDIVATVIDYSKS